MPRTSTSKPKKQALTQPMETPLQQETIQQPETQAVQAVSNAFVAAPARHKLATSSGTYGKIEVVTSNRLKRRFCNSSYQVKIHIPDTNYTALNIIGLQLGVTFDEVIRGLIEQHLASSDQTTGLSLFVPALY